MLSCILKAEINCDVIILLQTLYAKIFNDNINDYLYLLLSLWKTYVFNKVLFGKIIVFVTDFLLMYKNTMKQLITYKVKLYNYLVLAASIFNKNMFIKHIFAPNKRI